MTIFVTSVAASVRKLLVVFTAPTQLGQIGSVMSARDSSNYEPSLEKERINKENTLICCEHKARHYSGDHVTNKKFV